jgi:hypothetical protein
MAASTTASAPEPIARVGFPSTCEPRRTRASNRSAPSESQGHDTETTVEKGVR